MAHVFRTGSWLLHSVLATVLVCVVLGAHILSAVWHSLPDVTDRQLFLAKQSVVITDRDGQELYRFYHDADRTALTYDDVPAHMVHAIVAVEDKRFFTRGCIDIRALVRAVLANVMDFKSQGASTLTQQLARTVFLTREKTVERKIREVMLACAIERHYTKEEIVELYLNWISFGHGIAGLKQASKRYFGVTVSELSAAQSAVLAAIPQRPTYFSPYGPHRRTTVSQTVRASIRSGAVRRSDEIDPDDVVIGLLGTNVRLGDRVHRIPGRADLVLGAMHAQGYLSQEEWQQASRELSTLSFTPMNIAIRAPHFVITLEREMQQLVRDHPDLSEYDGLHIRSTIDPHLQQLAENVLSKSMTELREVYNAHNAALLVVDPRSNEILAYVGSPDFFDDERSGQIDMVRVPRQTGSSFKPVVYATLFEKGFTDRSFIYDSPLDPRTYRPARSGYYGRMTTRTALARSRNIPAIRAFYEAGGEDAVLNMAEAMGVGTPKWYRNLMRRSAKRFKYSWTLALGAAEASLLEMVQAYSVLGNGGRSRPITGVRHVSDYRGNTLFAPSRRTQTVLKAQTAEQITSILRDEEARETLWRYAMHLPFGPAALKTGTSTLCAERDLYGSCTELFPNNTWTIGYTDDLLVGVWIGNTDNTPFTQDGVALHTALPVWRTFMMRAHDLPSTVAQR